MENIINPAEIFRKTKALHLKGVIPKEFCHFFTHVLLRKAQNSEENSEDNGDSQVPTAKCILDHDLMFETAQERLWPIIENILGEPLLPTYSYARLYSNGDILAKHTDRPACEISITLQLGKSHEYSWPIYMGGFEYVLEEGDAVLYSGCDVEHWRDECKGPEGYFSGQVFMHFVRANGPYKDHAGDSTVRKPPVFTRFTSYGMETK